MKSQSSIFWSGKSTLQKGYSSHYSIPNRIWIHLPLNLVGKTVTAMDVDQTEKLSSHKVNEACHRRQLLLVLLWRKNAEFDQIIFQFFNMDLSLRIFKRHLTYRARSESMAAGCPERLTGILSDVILWDVWTKEYQRTLSTGSRNYPEKVIVLRSQRDGPLLVKISRITRKTNV